LNVSPTVTPEDLRVWTWSALARGAKGVNYYAWYPMSSGYESGGFGMIQLDGTVTERARVAGAIARVVDRNQQLFLKARPPRAEVAIVYNPMAHFVGGRQRSAAASGPQGEVAGIERDSLLGVYRAVFPLNIALDYVHVNELDLAQYKLVILPYPLMLPAASAEKLKAYVRGGGHLVAEARLGWSNESGMASERIPGMGLWEVMGCRETAVQTGDRGRTLLRWTDGSWPGMSAGEQLPARWYEETLEPLGSEARVVARFADDGAAAVASSFGQGKTLMLGSFVSAAYETSPSRETERFYAGLLKWAGVTQPLTATKVEARLLESGSDRLLFVFNHEKMAATANVTLRLGGGAFTATDLLENRPVAIVEKSDSIEVNLRLAPDEVGVVHLRRNPK
jgi:beta-galactosidase